MSTRNGACLAIVIMMVGCVSRQPAYQENSKVSVSAPFVNVNVADEGGVRVRAPFTNVDTTSRYQQTSPMPATTGPSVSTGSRFQPAGTSTPYNPMPTQGPFQPIGSIAPPSGGIPPATTIHR